VGITRAKKRLYLLRSYRRNLFGGSTANPPSRFLQDISPHLITPRRLCEESLTPVANPYPQASPRTVATLTVKVGDHVRHSKFGPGIVMSCSPTRDDQELTVAFEAGGVKKLLASLAPLERIDKGLGVSS
jgi:DNA helicase-2/ATP-dependent DNA helicase PcrA